MQQQRGGLRCCRRLAPVRHGVRLCRHGYSFNMLAPAAGRQLPPPWPSSSSVITDRHPSREVSVESANAQGRACPPSSSVGSSSLPNHADVHDHVTRGARQRTLARRPRYQRSVLVRDLQHATGRAARRPRGASIIALLVDERHLRHPAVAFVPGFRRAVHDRRHGYHPAHARPPAQRQLGSRHRRRRIKRPIPMRKLRAASSGDRAKARSTHKTARAPPTNRKRTPRRRTDQSGTAPSGSGRRHHGKRQD